MKGQSVFNLWFYLRKKRIDEKGKSTLYLRVICNGEQSTISLQRKIDVKSWDSKRGLVRPKTSGAAEINDLLEMVKNRAYDAYSALLQEGKGVTPLKIIDRTFAKNQREFTLVKLVEYHNREMELGIGFTSTFGNYKNYKTTINHLRDFLKVQYKRSDYLLTDIDLDFLSKYSLFLQESTDCNHNGAMKHMQRLKKILTLGKKLGWMRYDPFQDFKIKFYKYDKIILDKEELETIEGLTGLSPKLGLVRDAFVFSCYTGLAYVDLKNLTTDNILHGIDGNLWIITRRSKTDVKARIPLLPKPLDIIEKYLNHPKLTHKGVVPIYSNQKTNDYLKELAALAGIQKPLSFHVGRHVFATVITLSNGVPIETVSKALGHSDIRITQVYARVLDEKISYDFENLRHRLILNAASSSD